MKKTGLMRPCLFTQTINCKEKPMKAEDIPYQRSHFQFAYEYVFAVDKAKPGISDEDMAELAGCSVGYVHALRKLGEPLPWGGTHSEVQMFSLRRHRDNVPVPPRVADLQFFEFSRWTAKAWACTTTWRTAA